MSNKRKILMMALLLIAGIAIGAMVYKFTTDSIKKKQYKDLKEQVFTTETTPLATTVANETQSNNVTNPDETAITEETKPPFVSPVDFVELQQINSDIYAWLDIPDTDISYPVLQRDGDFEYYLRRGLDEQYSNDGSLFTEPGNARDMSDFNTIIYGHNLRSEAMFGTLKFYRDLTYLEEHRDIIIYTPYATFTYKVFAAVTYSDKLITYYYDFSTKEGQKAFLDSLDDIPDMNSYIMDDVEVTTEDRILTLSTCNSDKSQRFLVVAVLTNVDQ